MTEDGLLDLLYESLDLMHYGQNGQYGADIIAKVEDALRSAGREVPKYDQFGQRTSHR